MTVDKPQPPKTEQNEVTPPATLTANAVPDADMEHFSNRMELLRGGDPNPTSLPREFGITDTVINHSGTRDSRPNGLGSIEELGSEPTVQQLLNRSKKLGLEPMDPVSRAQKAFQDYEPYMDENGIMRLKPRQQEDELGLDPVSRAQKAFQDYEPYMDENGVMRLKPRQQEDDLGLEPMDPVSRAQKAFQDYEPYMDENGIMRLRPRQQEDDLLVFEKPLMPPRDTAKLPSVEEQARLKDQAKAIARMIAVTGNLDNLDAAFEPATRSGEDSLNFLVKAVNEELKTRQRPDLQLQYSFDTESAWYSRDTHGADIYYKPHEVQENHSTVGLVRSTRQQNLMTQHEEDRIKSVGSMIPPGYIRTSDPRPKLILE